MPHASPTFRASWALVAFGLLALVAAVAAVASEDDSDGEMHSLDSVDDGRTHGLDSVDDGRTHALDSVDDGRTHGLDSVDDGRTHGLDSVDAEADARSARPAAPAPEAFPPIEDGDWEAQAQRAKERIAEAEARLKQANAAYSNMRSRNYPSGDAKKKIVDERRAAEAYLNDAHDYYRRIERRAQEAGRPL